MEPIATWGGLTGVSRLVYKTTGPDHTPVLATALVRLPPGTPPDDGWPVVAWTHGTSGMNSACGLTMSAELEAGTAPIVARLNRAGYAVIAPDYLGLGPHSDIIHPYLHTSTEASATIDAVRAAHQAVSGLSLRWAVAGQSQGGHAALATGQRASHDAAALDFRGTAALAPASNVEHMFSLARPSTREMPYFPVGSMLAVLAGMIAVPQPIDVRSFLSPEGNRLVDEIATRCSLAWPEIVRGVSAGQVLQKSLRDNEFRRAIADYAAVPTSGYDAPILIVHGWKDSRVPLPLTLWLLAGLRRSRTPYEFHVVNTGHDDSRGAPALRYALAFLAEVLAPRRRPTAREFER
ncbi:MAG: lipase family protein [Gordonia sp. (in: high G+C Gram-positive bacteria)]